MAGFDISMYREMFLEEAEELFESADNLLLEAENNGSLDDDQMGQLFRDVHTLKGSGASVELAYFAEFTHDVENLMDQLRNHKIEFIPEMATTLIDCLDIMKEILALEADNAIEREKFDTMTTDLLVAVRAYTSGNASAPAQAKPTIETATTSEEETVKEESSSSNKNEAFDTFNQKAVAGSVSSEEEENIGFFDDGMNAQVSGAFGFFKEELQDEFGFVNSEASENNFIKNNEAEHDDFGFFFDDEEPVPAKAQEEKAETPAPATPKKSQKKSQKKKQNQHQNQQQKHQQKKQMMQMELKNLQKQQQQTISE